MREFIKNIKCEYTEKITALLKKHVSFALSGITNSAKIIILAQLLLKNKQKIIFISESEQIALKYQNDLKNLFGVNAVIFPYQDGSIYDVNSKNLYKYSNQIKILQNQNENNIIIIPQKALFEKFPDSYFFERNNINIKINDDINVDEFAFKLVKMGYKRKTLVADAGEFSIRGDIIDIFPLNENPFRIELWGDTVTDIRTFDASNQRSISKEKEAVIQPVYKFILDENSYKTIEKFIDKEDENQLELIEQLKNENYFEGIEYYEPYFNHELKVIPELISKEYIFIFDDYTQFKSKYEQTDENLKKQYEENIKTKLTLPLQHNNHLGLSEFLTTVSSYQKIYFDNFLSDEFDINIELTTELIPYFANGLNDIAKFIKEKLNQNYRIISATDYKNRIEEILREYEIPFSYDVSEKNSVYITNNIVLSGSIIEDCKLIIITDKEFFNKRSKDITGTRFNYRRENLDFIETLNDIKEGDYIVHMVHGIGIFKGLSKQTIDNEEKDYLTLEYAHGDKLHIPAEQINMLCRYRGSGSILPSLSKMGGNDWNNTKSKVKKAVEDVAQDLINLYAVRKLSQGYAFEPDSIWQYEMEDAFGYTETPDQMKAISQTKEDMESDKPMDRLICGDVGFGKTEVAIRAIFKAVMSSKQAAIVVPTTILALQHYQTISERFKPFPVKVELLSRFKSPKEQKEIIKKLILGEVDVVIGTHRLLQDDIQFKDLGLLVIDEEHKFGVKHKEKLKRLKKNIDILTMSATPIPRTLYMSLSGIKDMSIINTPPTNRLPIKTFVSEFKESIVKNAVNYEIEREGQVFYLYNRVESIYEFAQSLKNLLPNIRLAVAHGQMDKNELERIMTDFLNREYDVLLCTTIIESGLDIANANTMIIHDADKFGLAQLYQIRGRVGRTDRQAFCYCLYKQSKNLTSDAVKRLKYIKEFTTLGSGYQIAMRDIEIRGVGNVLGTKQHGQMVNVGFDTYCQLLEEAVQEIQEGKTVEYKPAIVDINVTAYIPDEWVGSKEQKMIEYKRLADVKSINELEIIQSEWKDRFSKMSEPVENLIKLVHLRLLASQAGISLIRETDSFIRIYTNLSKGEWNIITAKADKNITKYIKYTLAPNTCTDGKSILLLNRNYLNFEELFNILSNLFYHILKIGYDYNPNNKG
ncbi:MAG: transcription-repair coupling factor [Candidatus Gastranaerophilales bacterium]|nr:transcription-repair coupling factor [Candidatus Gastranaerophilales bacterium]